MTQGLMGASKSPVSIRQYFPTDRGDVLELDETVWNRTRSEAWFGWKYEENPYVPEPPVFVARADGRVVGARPFMGFRLRIGSGDKVLTALQPSDTMVHPEYRGQGIFTRMTEAALDYYTDRKPELCFNFPNEMSWPGYRKLGWRAVEERTTYYRPQDLETLLSVKTKERVERLVGRAAALGAQTLFDAWTRYGLSRENGEFTVERETGVPGEKFTKLYQQHVPEEIHVYRDEQFYEWRFASPLWHRRTYVAKRNGEPVVGIVARTRTTTDGVTVTQLADIVPLEGGPEWLAGLKRLIEAIITDYAHVDLFAASKAPIPGELLTKYGFLADNLPPLSWFTDHQCTFAARPLGDSDDNAWRLDGMRLADPSNWLLSFVARDTA